MTDAEKDWLEEYEELTKDALTDKPVNEQEDAFLLRVIGPDLKAWMDRGRKYGYGSYDEDGEPLEN